MPFTGGGGLDSSIDKASAWLADIDAGFGTGDRRLACRVLRAWLHNLPDRLSVEVAAQLPELLRGGSLMAGTRAGCRGSMTAPGT